jgi:hypothetical protein
MGETCAGLNPTAIRWAAYFGRQPAAGDVLTLSVRCDILRGTGVPY